jgi:GNAT superfamily N-acetyltransferase
MPRRAQPWKGFVWSARRFNAGGSSQDDRMEDFGRAPHVDQIAVRPATAADAPSLARLRYRFRAGWGEANEPEEVFVGRTAAWFATRLATDAWRGWVAVTGDGEIVGHVFVQLVEKIPNPLPEAEAIGYLTNCYVVPDWRNRGVGTCLVAAALAACDALDLESVILWPTEESRTLYERHGFAPPAKLLERPAEPSREDLA